MLDLARGCGDVAICIERLAVGDDLIDGIVIERKTYSDFATSLVDARCPHRPIVLLEGPAPAQVGLTQFPQRLRCRCP
jgi:hypothetical protein